MKRTKTREPWSVIGWMDDAPAICPTGHPMGLRLCIMYLDPDDLEASGDTGRTYYPDDPDYRRIRDLVTRYADEGRPRPASEMPDWAMRFPPIYGSMEE